MPSGDWKLIVTDVSGNEMGELVSASNVRITYALNRPTSMSFSLRQGDPLVSYIIEGKSRVKAYRNGVLRAYNVIWDCVDEFSDASTVDVNTASPMHLLSKRFAPTSTTFTTQTPTSIIKSLIDAQNTIYPTHIQTQAVPSVGVTSVTVDAYKNVFDAISEVSDGFDWLDWEVVPGDLSAVGGVFPMGTLTVHGDGQGDEKTHIYFEFGIGKDNLLSVSVDNRLDTLSTDVIVTGKDEAVSVSPSGEYTGPRADYKALYQTLEAFSDLTEQGFLDSLRVAYHEQRKTPRQMVSFTPNPEAGEYHPFDDYSVGDIVSFRLDEGRKSINGSVRIYGFSIEVGATGGERVTEIRTAENG